MVFDLSPPRKQIQRAVTVAAVTIGNAMSEGENHPSLLVAILVVKKQRMMGPAKHQTTRQTSILNDEIGSSSSLGEFESLGILSFLMGA